MFEDKILQANAEDWYFLMSMQETHWGQSASQLDEGLRGGSNNFRGSREKITNYWKICSDVFVAILKGWGTVSESYDQVFVRFSNAVHHRRGSGGDTHSSSENFGFFSKNYSFWWTFFIKFINKLFENYLKMFIVWLILVALLLNRPNLGHDHPKSQKCG